MTEPPSFIDEHRITVPAPPERAWRVVRAYAGSLGFPEGGVAGRLVGLVWAAEPASGFEVVDEVEGREVVLAGRHRYSTYRLVFEVAEAPGGSVLVARSYGDFPGAAGRIYRTLVIGSRSHVLAVRRMLRTIGDRVS